MKQSKLSLATLLVASTLFLSGCSFFSLPGEPADNGRSTDPRQELFVIHSLAETISSLALESDGSFGSIQADAQYLGAVPNHLFRRNDEILVTLSGQSELLRLDESTLRVKGRVSHGAGSNPMETTHLYPGAETTNLADGVVVSTHLLKAEVRIDDLENRKWIVPPPWTFSVGQAPQPLLTLPGSSRDQVRLLVGNTNFSTDSSDNFPFGRASLTTMTFTLSESVSENGFSLTSTASIDLERSGFNPSTESGSNPTLIIDAPMLGEVLVVGSGENYGADGTGADDGVLISLDRSSLTVLDRYHLGGSPGAGVLVAEGSGHRLYLGGPRGIRSIYHDGTRWAASATLEYDATTAGGSLPFIADIAHYGNRIYAADFANSRVLAFSIGASGELTLVETAGVSQGPIGLLVDLE